MIATKLLTRFLPAAAVVAGLLIAAPAADAGKKKPVKASVALGDKRPAKAHIGAAKKTKARRAAVTCTNTDVMPTPETLELVEDALLCLHNQVRAERGLPSLRRNARLARAALSHSTAMVKEGFFEHTGLDGDTFVDRILAARYVKRNDAWTLGENLAWGTGELSTPAEIMRAWMNSSGHRANIVKKAYREIGIGIRLGVPSDPGVGATITATFGAKL